MSAVNTQKILHENIDNFFVKTVEKYKENIVCKNGCAQCCLVDFSIFPIEALVVIEWFAALDSETKLSVQKKLQESFSVQAKNQSKTPRCAFLQGESCAIYEARPTICRSQGLPLLVKVEDKKNNIEIKIDHCPKNFGVTPPAQADCLDLDRLNILQVIANNQIEIANLDKSLQNLITKDKRISLRDLAKYLENLI